MKISITEFRDMIAEAVRRTVSEAKKKKLTAPRSEESVAAERDRQVRGLPGHTHSQVLDMSKPLGRKNLAKRQGAVGMGNWTSEGLDSEQKAEAVRALVRMIVDEEIRVRRGR